MLCWEYSSTLIALQHVSVHWQSFSEVTWVCWVCCPPIAVSLFVWGVGGGEGVKDALALLLRCGGIVSYKPVRLEAPLAPLSPLTLLTVCLFSLLPLW